MRGRERRGVDDVGKMGERSRAGLQKGGSRRALAGRGRCRGQDRNRSMAGMKAGQHFNEDQWINNTLSEAHCDDIL